MATNKKLSVPPIGSLLGKITEKRENGEIPKTELQKVVSVDVEPVAEEKKSTGGRPTMKLEGVEYARLGQKIPKKLKQLAEIAVVEERFKDDRGFPIKTLDELVTLALERLLKQ